MLFLTFMEYKEMIKIYQEKRVVDKIRNEILSMEDAFQMKFIRSKNTESHEQNNWWMFHAQKLFLPW